MLNIWQNGSVVPEAKEIEMSFDADIKNKVLQRFLRRLEENSHWTDIKTGVLCMSPYDSHGVARYYDQRREEEMKQFVKHGLLTRKDIGDRQYRHLFFHPESPVYFLTDTGIALALSLEI